ncbi:MAG: alpha/beta fold hydrolase [Acidimicrobiales bacterium]|nr:alpha/beta fold hydrolase [Acidimicrobiales bacterium]
MGRAKPLTIHPRVNKKTCGRRLPLAIGTNCTKGELLMKHRFASRVPEASRRRLSWMKPGRGFGLGRRRLVAALGVAAALAIATAAPPAQAELPVGGLNEAISATMFSPKQVPGANDWNCKPTAVHPRPVVLVHGTFENMGFNWATLSPMLKNAGYCVFALNYGYNLLSLDQRFSGLDDIAKSADQLRAFVDRVLAVTGATKVDIVGHSQGGMMPNYYIKRLGGASKVNMLVGLAPSNHGTTLSGIQTLGKQLGLLTGFNTLAMLAAPSLVQQQVGSSFQNALFADGDTVPGVKYVVIATKKDLIVTPYTNAFLSGSNVRNITIQDQCPTNNVGHIGLNYDSPTMQNVLNVLGPNVPNFRAVCTNFGPPI